jgi:hypothetical protein
VVAAHHRPARDRRPTSCGSMPTHNGCDAYYEVEPAPGGSSCLDPRPSTRVSTRAIATSHMHLGRSSLLPALPPRVAFEVGSQRITGARAWLACGSRACTSMRRIPANHALCDRAADDQSRPAAAGGRGPASGKWSIEFATEGVVDLVWDVTASGPPAGAATEVIQLRARASPRCSAYGSLLSIASLERTLGPQLTRDPFASCTLDGWRRRGTSRCRTKTFILSPGRSMDHAAAILLSERRADAQTAAYNWRVVSWSTARTGALSIRASGFTTRVDVRLGADETFAARAVRRGSIVPSRSNVPRRIRRRRRAAPSDRLYLNILAAGHRALGRRLRLAYAASLRSGAHFARRWRCQRRRCERLVIARSVLALVISAALAAQSSVVASAAKPRERLRRRRMMAVGRSSGCKRGSFR